MNKRNRFIGYQIERKIEMKNGTSLKHIVTVKIIKTYYEMVTKALKT